MHNSEQAQKLFSRTRLMLGDAAVSALAGCRVAVFGIGGVGGYVVEVLARSGIGALDLFDNDRVSPSNINRQIIALQSTIGRYKVDVARERVLDINPECRVNTHRMFYLVRNANEVDLSVYDYVVDCIDTVSAKMELVRRCKSLEVPVICSMGAANKLDATAFRVADITQTIMDPLAKIMRKHLRREGIRHFKCVYSPEVPLRPLPEACTADDVKANGQPAPASNAFVPAAAGIIIGGEVVKDLLDRAGLLRTTRTDNAVADQLQ